MALRVRFQYLSGASLGYSIERLSDGLLYDFAATGATAGTFTATPTTTVASLPADTGSFAGRYKVNLTSTPTAQFTDGDYCVTIHNTASSNAVVGELDVVMHNGDDATVIPSSAGVDPWNQALPGSYAVGTAGYAVGTNLDAKISSRLASTSYIAPPTDYQQRSQPVLLPTTAPSWYTAPPTDYQQRNLPIVLPTTAPAWYAAPPTDYQQRNQAVVLPTTAPAWYAAPPTDYQQRNQAIVLPTTAPAWYAAPPTDYQQRNQSVVLPTTAPAWYVTPPTDYQQRTQPVMLPTTPPVWYTQASTGPTVAQIVAGVWDEPRSSHINPSSFGACLDASISSRLSATADTPGTTALLSRLSSSRAAYLDALNVSGTVASHADVAAIQNNTLVRIFTPDVVQRPQTGSIARIIHLYTYDEQGNMATPDSAPAISVWNGVGASRNGNLDVAAMVMVATGHYKAVYTLQSTDPTEQLVWAFTVVQNGQSRQYGGSTEVVDVMSVDFNANDRANLNALLSMAGTTGVVVASASKTGYALSAQEHATITADAVAALNSPVPASPMAGSVFDRVDAPVSSRSTYAGGPVASVSAPVVVGQNNDKTGYALAAAGLDAIAVEPGINVRQALAPILAATSGVISGAGSGTITIKGGNAATTRIMATTDSLGNRSAVILTVPN